MENKGKFIKRKATADYILLFYIRFDQNKEREVALRKFELAEKLNQGNVLLEREKLSKITYDFGVRLFKNNANEDVNACRLLTHAIFTAPEDSERLMLSFKQRYEVLIHLKLWQDAISDFERALLIDKNLSDQVKKELLDAQKLTPGVVQMPLMQLQEILSAPPMECFLKMTYNKNVPSSIPKHINIQKSGVLKTDCPIAKGKEIFQEAPFAFYPLEESRKAICHNCAATQIIPICCNKCNGNITYCSTQCKNTHFSIHQYECLIFQFGWYKELNNFHHLALRMVITGLPTIVHLLKNQRTFKDMWQCIFNELLDNDDTNYCKVIKMRAYADELKKGYVTRDMRMSSWLAIYLRHKTNFFDMFKQFNTSIDEWERLIGALLLLHYQQIPFNARALSIVLVRNLLLTPDMSGLKQRRIQRGYLYSFNDCNHIAIAIYPYLSFCAAKCERMFTIHQIGCNLSLRATRDIYKGEQIYEHVDSMNMSLWPRMICGQFIAAHACPCVLCKGGIKMNFMKPNSNEYICEHPDCKSKFYSLEECLGIDMKCSKCGHIQGWRNWFTVLAHLTFSERGRACLFKHFDYICEHVRQPNNTRMLCGLNILLKCLESHTAGHSLKYHECLKLYEIWKVAISDLMHFRNTNASEYLKYMVLIWDVIAISSIEVSKSMIFLTLDALSVIPLEEKKQFIYYYDDYIKEHVK